MKITGRAKTGKGPGRQQGAKPTRTGQLSKLMRLLLQWLVDEEKRMASGSAAEKKELRSSGIPWNTTRFLESKLLKQAQALNPKLRPNRHTLSRAKKELEEERGLVNCYGLPTTHVKLSGEGREVGEHEQLHGMSSWALKQKKRIAHNEAKSLQEERDQEILAEEFREDMEKLSAKALQLSWFGLSDQERAQLRKWNDGNDAFWEELEEAGEKRAYQLN